MVKVKTKAKIQFYINYNITQCCYLGYQLLYTILAKRFYNEESEKIQPKIASIKAKTALAKFLNSFFQFKQKLIKIINKKVFFKKKR